MKAREVFRDRVIDVTAGAHATPPVAAMAEMFGRSETDRLQRRHVGIKLVDLECSGQPAQHALVHRQSSDVVALEQDAAGIGLEHAGQKIDHGCLAGAVRADQRVARTGLDLERADHA